MPTSDRVRRGNGVGAGLARPQCEVRLAVLGPMRAEVGGAAIDLGGLRQRAVLAHLIVARREVVSAERLVDALWPAERPADPLASLQSFVSHLRRRLQPDAGARDRTSLITSGGSGYALRLPPEAVDAWRFEELVQAGDAVTADDPARGVATLRDALDLWEGAAYAEYADQPWAQPEAARLTELRTLARERLLGARLALGEAALVVPELEALVAEAPLREERWRLLALALYRAQRQADALATLRRARAVLADELGVDPGPALRALERQMLEQSPMLEGNGRAPAATGPGARITAATVAAAPPAPTSTPDDTLVERQRELSVLDALIDSACAGTGQLAFVEGPAGIGKSRLLTEARRAAVRRGATVLHARASQLEQEFSFGVARQLFEPVVIDPAERQALLHGAAGSAAAVFDLSSASATGDDSSFATLHGLYWLVVNLASRGPVVIVVDDIHWCDAGSLRFLAYLHRRLDGLTAALVLAHRSGEQHALGALIDDLRHDPATVSVRPVPLTRQAVAAMIGGRLGAVADEEFVDACFSGTTGNPLLVRQLLRALEADGIRPDRASAGVARALGSRAVSSMVLLRLRRLPQAAAVARALTILGDGAALPDVAQLAGVSETEAAELTRLLVAAEIIRPEPPLAFVHPLVRDAIYGDVPPGDRELLHEAAAQLLHGSGRSDEQVAAQLLQAPRRGQGWVVEVLRRAASDAVRRGSADGAVTFLKRALAEPPPRELRGQVLMELGLVETTTDGPAAGRDLQAAYETLADDASRATAALALTRTLVFVGQLGSPVRFAEDALRRLPDELVDERTAVLALQRIAGSMHGVAPERWNFDTEPPIPGTGYGSRMLQASVAYERMCRARPRADAVEMAAASLADGQLVNTDPGLLWVWSQVVLDLADEDVLPMWDSINATAHERGSLFSVLAVGFWRAWSLMRRGELAEAEHSIRIGMEQLDMWQRNAMTLPYGRAVLARVLYDQDRLDEARAVIRRDGEVPSRIDGARLVVEIEAEMLLSDRRPELALHRLETVLDRTPHAVNPAWRRDRLLWCAAAGAVGRVPEARERAEDLLQLARRWGAASTIGDVLLMLGRLDGADGIETLREAVAVLEGSPMRIRHADALISLGTRLAARDPGEATRALHAAHGIGCRTGAARIVRRAREALQAAGLPAPTEESATATTPTSTQRRILELLDAGATVPEIGQRLFLTPSTVQGHIDELRRRDAAASRAG